MLTGLAETVAPPVGFLRCAAALVAVLIGEGKLEEAAADWPSCAPAGGRRVRSSCRGALVCCIDRRGELGRADTMLGADSTIEGLALSRADPALPRGYRGSRRGVQGGRPLCRRPSRGDPPHPAPGAAPADRGRLRCPRSARRCFTLEQGDTAAAVTELEGVAEDLPPAKGGAELRLLAGRLAAAAGDRRAAERLFRAAALKARRRDRAGGGAGPGRAAARTTAEQEAVALLEHLILTYPRARWCRRPGGLLDQARGAVPQT